MAPLTDRPPIIVASRLEAGVLLTSGESAAAIRHVISIASPGDAPPPGLAARTSRIRLLFDDVIADTDSESAPRLQHVRAVVAFARKIEDQPGMLLIHCEAGISRSSAAALTAFATWAGPGHERLSVERTFAARPEAVPNRRFVELADALLRRDGALLASLERAQQARVRQLLP
jgi:predicted protein tyrosine phosphatase